MADHPNTLNGITVKVNKDGDLHIVIHKDDLARSLAEFSPRQNGTVVAVAVKRSFPSRAGHTHNKAVVICQKEGQEM